MIKSKETVVLIGKKSDPEIRESMKKIIRGGRAVKLEPRESHDTGVGPCGKHLCNCKGVCIELYGALEKELGPNPG